jgi:hypothetical protein
MSTHWSVHVDPLEWAEACAGDAAVAARTDRGIVVQAIDEQAPIDAWAQSAAVLGARVRTASPTEYALLLVGEVEQEQPQPNPDLPHNTETLIMVWGDRRGEHAMILIPFLRVAGVIAWGEPFAMEGVTGHLDFEPVEAAFWRAATVSKT